MATTSIEQEMYQYFEQLNPEEQKSVVHMIGTFLKGKKPQPVSLESERISIEQYNKEIDEAMKSREKGDYITIEELEARSEKW